MNRSRAALEGRAEVERAVAPARGPDDVAEVRPDDRRAAAVLGQPGGDQADDPDGPRPADDGRGARPAPSATAARASATAVFIRSRRVRLAASSASAWTAGLDRVVGEQEPGGLERLPHPAGRVEPRRDGERRRSRGRPRRVRSGRARGAPRSRAAARVAAAPARAGRSPGSRRRSARRRRPIPIVARSARSRAAAGPPGSSASSSWATLKATPLPARRRSG